MAIKKSFEEVLERPMDRKEFLTNCGAAVLAIVGVSSILKAFQNEKVHHGQGYGGGGYGR